MSSTGYLKHNGIMKIRNIIINFFVFFISIIPLIVWGGYYEGPKVFLFTIFGFCLTLFWLHRILIKKNSIILNKSDNYYLLWLLILIISSLFGVHPLESIIGGSYRHQGFLFFLSLWLLYKTIQLFNTQEKTYLAKGVALTTLIEVFIVFLQFVLGRVYFGKPLGTLGEANAVAGFVAIGTYYIMLYFPKIFLIFPVIAIFIAQSRSGILAIIPGIISLTNLSGQRFKKLFLVTTAVLLIPVIIYITFIKNNRSFDTIESRQVIWPLALQQILKRPILGYGAESGESVYNLAFSKINRSLNYLIIDRTHNLFLDVAMWSGGMGLIFFIGFLVERFKNLDDKNKKFLFFSFIIYSMFQPLSIVHWLFLFLM